MLSETTGRSLDLRAESTLTPADTGPVFAGLSFLSFVSLEVCASSGEAKSNTPSSKRRPVCPCLTLDTLLLSPIFITPYGLKKTRSLLEPCIAV